MSRPFIPNDWTELERLVDAVLDAAPERRAARIDELTGDDEAKRATLRRLVADCERAAPFLERPAMERFGELLSDSTMDLPELLGERYRLTSELGQGGMATVYLAQDLKHNRQVAVKVLRPELAALLGTERFFSEIRVTANLQHPHLLPLFDSGEAAGMLYYVMPYVAGESLRGRLERERQLPVEDAVRIAVAVASALDYAHRHHVIHRDLKPENILLQDGEPQVADFGIALAISQAGGERLTQTGLTLGTPLYMSPEQAAGDRSLDARTDIYSLGAVLYEMLAGEPPHTGSTAQAIIAKVLSEKARPLRALRDAVPEHVDAAVLKALATLRADRFATAAEFAEALTGVRPVVTVSRASTPPAGKADVMAQSHRQRPTSRWLPWAVAVAGISAAIAAGRAGWLTTASPAVPMRLEVVLPDSAPLADDLDGAGGIALSRDATQLVYVGKTGVSRRLYLRRLDGADVRRIPGTEGANAPLFSQDGRTILFSADGKLKMVAVSGGVPVVVADSAGGGSLEGNTAVFVRSGQLWRVPIEGGTPQLLARPDSTRSHYWYYQPHILPGGRAALFTLFKGSVAVSASQLGIVTLPGGAVTELGIKGAFPLYVSAGYLLFSRGEGLMAAPFSLSSLRVTGAPVEVLNDAAVNRWWSADISVAPNGTLAYVSAARSKGQLVRVTRSGSVSALTSESQDFNTPRLSPDGRRVAVTVFDLRGQDVWVHNVADGTLARLTNDGASRRAVWLDGGLRIAYMTPDSGRFVVKQQASDGSGPPKVLFRSDENVYAFTVGPPGTYAVLQTSRGGPSDLSVVPLDSLGAPRRLAGAAGSGRLPRISPNGQLLAYVSDETGRAEVYVTRLPGPNDRVLVSTDGGTEPVWAASGRELFYRAPTHVVSAQIIESPRLAVARRDSLFRDSFLRRLDGDHAQYDVFPSGKEFLMIRSDSVAATRFFVVVNWFEELRRLMRTK